MTQRLAALCSCAVFVPLLLVGGCPPFTGPQPDIKPGDNVLKPFGSTGEVVDYFRTQVNARAQTGRSGMGFFFGAAPMAAAEDGSADQATGANESAGGDDATTFSETNIQEVGVDESDIVKSDGTHFYIAKAGSLRIVKATPMNALEEVGRVDFDARVDSLYLRGDDVLVLTQDYDFSAPGGGAAEIAYWPPYRANAFVRVYQIDVSTPADPTIAGEIELDGSLVSSRVTNDRLILILTVSPDLPASPTPLQVSQFTIAEIMPQSRVDGVEDDLVVPGKWFHPLDPDGYNTTAVVSLDADNVETIVGATAIMADAGTIYASTEAVYVTDIDYDADNDYREITNIHKLSFDADGVAQYVASGAIPGRLLNQFSLSEYDGKLRVATHVDNWQVRWGGPFWNDIAIDIADAPPPTAQSNNSDLPEGPYNAVYVLGEAAGKLDVTGLIEGIAPGERLYSARFMGPRGYLVTFIQIDPLFVLDLTDATAPVILGELKVPGYSDYLHPYGEDRLIGVGRSTKATQWGGVIPDAVQVSLFDVSDPTDPTLIDQIEVGGEGSMSDVSTTHKAFTLMPEMEMLALPVRLWPDGQAYYGPAYDGVLCLDVDADTGFTELGRLASVTYEDQWWTEWRRAAFIDDDLYAITPAGVRAADIADIGTTSEVELTPEDDDQNHWIMEVDAGGGMEI